MKRPKKFTGGPRCASWTSPRKGQKERCVTGEDTIPTLGFVLGNQRVGGRNQQPIYHFQRGVRGGKPLTNKPAIKLEKKKN